MEFRVLHVGNNCLFQYACPFRRLSRQCQRVGEGQSRFRIFRERGCQLHEDFQGLVHPAFLLQDLGQSQKQFSFTRTPFQRLLAYRLRLPQAACLQMDLGFSQNGPCKIRAQLQSFVVFAQGLGPQAGSCQKIGHAAKR